MACIGLAKFKVSELSEKTYFIRLYGYVNMNSETSLEKCILHFLYIFIYYSKTNVYYNDRPFVHMSGESSKQLSGKERDIYNQNHN